MNSNDSQKCGELPDGGQAARPMVVQNPARTFGSFSLATSSCTEPGGAPTAVPGNGADAAECSRR